MFKEVSLVYFSSTKTTQRTVRAIGRALAKAFDIPVQEYDFTLPNTLSAGLAIPKQQALDLLERAGVASNLRAEQLSMQQFADVANAL